MPFKFTEKLQKIEIELSPAQWTRKEKSEPDRLRMDRALLAQ